MITITKNKLDPVWGQLWKKLKRHVWFKIPDREWDQTTMGMRDQMFGLVLNRIWVPIHDQTTESIESGAGNRVTNQIYDNHNKK
jgi:hypothetical protein